MLERDASQRGRRLADAAADRIRERVRPTRPRMRALQLSPGGRFAWRSVAAPPPPGPHAAVVHPLAVATCDMDRPIALGDTPFAMPLCFGHECVAEVLAVGEEVRTVRPGDRVVVPFQISCGTCSRCRAGLTANCLAVPPISMYGFGVTGGHWGGAVADELAVPFADGMLVPLPEGVEPAAAASVADNVSDAHRHIAPFLPGLLERDGGAAVLIVGGMTRRQTYTASVPLYAGLIARALGATDVHVLDARAYVRAEAQALGLGALAPGAARELPRAPLVVDVSGTPKGLRLALGRTAPDGICTSAGGLHRSARIPVSYLYGRNVSLHISRAHARTIIPQVLELVTRGLLRPESVTTALARIDDAVPALREHVRAGTTKTILTA
jgi:alcohol dehydrogenase